MTPPERSVVKGEKGRGYSQMKTQLEQVTPTEQSVMKQTG